MNQTKKKENIIWRFIKSILFFIMFFVGIFLLFSSGVLLSQQEPLKNERSEWAVLNSMEDTSREEQESNNLTEQDELTMEAVSPITPVLPTDDMLE